MSSTSVTTNASGQCTSAQWYYTYGDIRTPAPSVPCSGTPPTDYGFTGQRFDSSGLMYYGARYYDPTLGRFVSADTVVPQAGNPQDFNRYSYARNNPIRYTDPTGHICVPCVVVVGVVVLKVADYGWTAWDAWQDTQTLANPQAPDEDKLVAGVSLALTVGFEALEPDDLLPVGVPADDVARKLAMEGLQGAIRKDGLRGGVKFVSKTFGKNAPEVFHHLYQQGLFRGVKSYKEWRNIVEGSGLHVHHLLEKRWARYFGLDEGSISSVVLDPLTHNGPLSAEGVTQMLLDAKPRGSAFETFQDLWDYYKDVYGRLDHKDWLDTIWPHFEGRGVTR